MHFFAVLAVVSLAALQGVAEQLYNSKNVVFIIMSQREPYHSSMASWLKADIERQAFQYEQRKSPVVISSEEWEVNGAWRIVPLLRPLLARYAGGDVRWLVFLEPHTTVHYPSVLATLARMGEVEGPIWFGSPLYDREPTIIHHFAVFEEFKDLADQEQGFTYPNFASGFALTIDIIKWLIEKIDKGERETKTDFSIDPAFELAKLIYGEGDDHGPLMLNELSLCVVSSPQCTTYPKPFAICGSRILESSIYFAVKTWSGFHDTRARLVKETWGAHVTHLQFFSDKNDPDLPAIDLGVPNTRTGHCAKTMAILRYVTEKVQDMPDIEWIFLADDDTILGVRRLTEVLSCYRGGDSLTVLGERYGYGYSNMDDEHKGYDYITTGGGMALSRAAAALLSRCACAAPTAPDDMTLGACAHAARLHLTHSPLFHQARPQDYSPEYLARDHPVSFHRLRDADPGLVYERWFRADDSSLNLHDPEEF